MSSDDLSLEPLINQSAEGDGINRKIAFIPVDTAGAASNRTALAIDNTATEIVPSATKRTVEVMNTGSNKLYYGGSGVDENDGLVLFSNEKKIFSNVKDTFSIHFVAEAAKSSTLRIVEYD